MGTNYCKSKGLISVCEMSRDIIEQQLCKFSEPPTELNITKDRHCMHLGKLADDHCDNAHAQWDAKVGKMVAPFHEEQVFNIADRNT